jgi:hypothetical protein
LAIPAGKLRLGPIRILANQNETRTRQRPGRKSERP